MGDVKNQLDKILVIQWMSLLGLYFGYFIGSLINIKEILLIVSSLMAIFVSIIYFIKGDRKIYCVIFSALSGIVIAQVFVGFQFEVLTIAIMLGYGLLLLIINFAFKIVSFHVVINIFLIVFLTSIGIYNYFEDSLASQMNLVMIIYLLPIFIYRLYQLINKKDNSELAMAYLIGFLVVFFIGLLS